MIVYLNGRFLPKDEARISPDDRGFLFADGVYEVLRAYEGRFFRAKEHFLRLARSVREIRMQEVKGVDFAAVCAGLLEQNQLTTGDATVYIQITRGAAWPRNHLFPEPTPPPTVYASAARFNVVPAKATNGVRVALVPDLRWARCDIKSIALLPNILACQQGKDAGADEAVQVRDGLVTEGSRTNFAAIFKGAFVTHPRDERILGGISLNAAHELCAQLGIPVQERAIPEAELKSADEMLLLGTTMEITPVVQVDDWKVGNGAPGPVTRKLQQGFQEMVKRELGL